MSGPVPGTPTPWRSRDDYTTEGFVTIIGNIDGEYIDGQARCTYDVVCRCEDEYGERLPNVAANVRAIVHRVNNWDALEAERDALQARVDALVEAASTLAMEAVLLLNNAEGCALSHYGHDAEQFGMPQWLADSRAKIETARAALSQGERS